MASRGGWLRPDQRDPRPGPCFHSLVRHIDGLLHDVDQRLRQGAPEKLLAPVRADLDALAGDLRRLELALAA
jgi:hypothetical protein